MLRLSPVIIPQHIVQKTAETGDIIKAGLTAETPKKIARAKLSKVKIRYFILFSPFVLLFNYIKIFHKVQIKQVDK
jgi:hypothetical protein